MASQRRYTSTAEVQDFMINNIAPNYFDFENTNNYRAGLFGYINEVIAQITMDTHNAINIARREFYPVTAENPRSFYKMAALQKLGLPLVTPGQCKAVLLLDVDEVIDNSTYKNGIYTCIIDNSVSIMADNIPFSLLYPIVIISNETSGGWNHTIHYDKSNTNDLDKQKTSYYISHRSINQDGKRYLLLSVTLYQCEMIPKTEMITTDGLVETVSVLFEFEGDLADFEVFYTQDPDEANPTQLVKLMQGQAMVEVPFCYYRLLNANQIELTFPNNIYFTPELNSEIQCNIYTSLGKAGEFPSFKGDLSCKMQSEKYPYNNNMTMLGKVDGKCHLSAPIPTMDSYKETIKAAYATNNTITTSNDLQVLFDENSRTYNKIFFRKKRHDAFDRLFGAYVLLRDTLNNVIPTNTLTLKIALKEFDSYNDTSSKAIIKPGKLFEYDPESYSMSLYTGKPVNDLKFIDDLSEYDDSSERFIYTNPFLIMCTMEPNLIGYYINSINTSSSVIYSYMNDGSIIQFIGNNFAIERNAIIGEDFYKISIQISPTSDLDAEKVILKPDINDADYVIRAEESGSIIQIYYDTEMKTPVAEILYDSGNRSIIQIGSYVDHEPEDTEDEEETNPTYGGGMPDDEDEEPDEIEDNYYVHSGYSLNVKPYERFIEGDILAYRKITDRGKIRAALDIDHVLFDNGLYIPMFIEEYNEENNIYTLVTYISTDDIIDTDNTLLVNNGIYGITGEEDTDIAIPFKDLRFAISIFYRSNEVNILHKYSSFDYFDSHTLTNTYMESSDNGISLIQFVSFVRSTITFDEDTTPVTNIEGDVEDIDPSPNPDDEIDEEDDIFEEDEDTSEDDEDEEEDPDEDLETYGNGEMDEEIVVTIKEVPLIKANWIKDQSNYLYVIESLLENYETLETIYYDLENNFNFDLKFYNTYGKSKFFKAGISNRYQPLSQVNCSFRFGIHLPGFTSQATFLEKFRPFVKEYIEAVNSTTNNTQSIFILSLTKAIYDNFPEVGHCEYFGFNNFNEDTQKIIPVSTKEMTDELLANYIPEFINIASHKEDGETVLNIDVEFLDLTEEAQ